MISIYKNLELHERIDIAEKMLNEGLITIDEYFEILTKKDPETKEEYEKT